MRVSSIYSLEIYFDGSDVIYRIKRYGTEYVKQYLSTLPTTLEMFGDGQNDILMSILEKCNGVSVTINEGKPIRVSVSSCGETVTLIDGKEDVIIPMYYSMPILSKVFREPRLVVMELARLKVLQLNEVNNEG